MKKVILLAIAIIVGSYFLLGNVVSGASGDMVGVPISFTSPKDVWLADFSVTVTGGILQDISCNKTDFSAISQEENGCTLTHNEYGVKEAQVAMLYIELTDGTLNVTVTGKLQDYYWNDVDGAEYVVGDAISVTPTPTSEPTPTLTTPTPSVFVPMGPTQVTIELPRKMNQATEKKEMVSIGEVIVRCESVYDGGKLAVNVFDSPPGQLTSQYTSLKSNFDLRPISLGCNNMTVCLPYLESEVSSAGLTEGQLGLYEFHNDSWQDVTSFVNPVDNQICGKPVGFSPFIVARDNNITPTPSGTLTPSPTTSITSTPANTLTPTPTGYLPKSGTTQTTAVFFGVMLVVFIAGAFMLL